jgi:Tol biopolymer transport system component
MRWARAAYLLIAALPLLVGVLVPAGCGGGAGDEKPTVAIQGTIVFVWGHEGSQKTGIYSDIYLLDAQGVRLLADHAGINWAHPAWSPDGTQIAYITDEYQLAVINRDGSGGAYLTPKVSDTSLWPSRPEWLPDGNISFVAAEQIAVLSPDGSGARVLKPDNYTSGSFAWSPDGTQIVFDGSDLMGPEVFLFDVESGESRTLMTPSQPFESLACSPDGKAIVAADTEGDLYVFGADGEDLYAITQPARAESPAWSPDGKMIVYEYFGDPGPALWVMNADGTVAQQLLSYGSQPDWTAR